MPVTVRDRVPADWAGPRIDYVHTLHIAVATGLYVYARRQTHALVALGVGVLVLFLGTASTNLLYAGALNHVIALAAGTWALVVMLREPLLPARKPEQHRVVERSRTWRYWPQVEALPDPVVTPDLTPGPVDDGGLGWTNVDPS